MNSVRLNTDQEWLAALDAEYFSSALAECLL